MQLIVMYCFRMSTAYSLDTGGAGFTAAFIDNEEKEEGNVKRDRTLLLTKPKIDEKDYKKITVRPQNWRKKDEPEDPKSLD